MSSMPTRVVSGSPLVRTLTLITHLYCALQASTGGFGLFERCAVDPTTWSPAAVSGSKRRWLRGKDEVQAGHSVRAGVSLTSGVQDSVVGIYR